MRTNMFCAYAMAPASIVRLYVATPCYGCSMATKFLLSLIQLQGECARRGIECGVDLMGNESLVPRARNILTARFRKSGATHLLFVDADISFSPEAVFRLLDSDKDIVTGVYPRKSYDWGAVGAKLKTGSCGELACMMGLDYNINIVEETLTAENGCVKVLDSATGFMMIKRGVIDTMAEKYKDSLSCVNDLPGNRDDPTYPHEYVALFDCMIDPKTRRYLSEDFAFVRRAQAVGYDVWADLTTPLCHIGTYTYDGDLRQRFKLVYAG